MLPFFLALHKKEFSHSIEAWLNFAPAGHGQVGLGGSGFEFHLVV
jgi:hypothetical protein